MIKLEQIRELNEKVQSTLEVVRLLREENGMLKNKLAENEERVKELEVLVSSFRNDQDEIEEGIKGILLQLDRLEEEFTAPPAPRSAAAEVTEEPSSVEESGEAAAPVAENAAGAQESSHSEKETASSPMESETPNDSEEVAVSSEGPFEEKSSQEGPSEENKETPLESDAPPAANEQQEPVQNDPAAEEAPAAPAAESELDIF